MGKNLKLNWISGRILARKPIYTIHPHLLFLFFMQSNCEHQSQRLNGYLIEDYLTLFMGKKNCFKNVAQEKIHHLFKNVTRRVTWRNFTVYIEDTHWIRQFLKTYLPHSQAFSRTVWLMEAHHQKIWKKKNVQIINRHIF